MKRERKRLSLQSILERDYAKLPFLHTPRREEEGRKRAYQIVVRAC
jgi:hypothetical protein